MTGWTEDKIFKDAWKAIQSGRGGVVTLSEAIQHVEDDPNSVFMTSIDVIAAHYQKHCRLKEGYIGKSTYFPTNAGFPVRKGYKNISLINEYIDALRSGGLFDYMIDKYTTEKCPAVSAGQKNSVTFPSHLRDTFTLVLYALCMSTAVFLLLVLASKLNKRICEYIYKQTFEQLFWWNCYTLNTEENSMLA